LKKVEKIKFIDFCAGIGGGRLGLEKNGLKCVGYSEIDTKALQTYTLFYGNNELSFSDLTKINTENLPDFNVLIGGFPCQTFSIVGKRQGFEDNRGLIIYSLINILVKKNINYFILENVKGLVSHDNGNTLKIILKSLDNAGYNVKYSVLNSENFRVPQMRERIYFVGIKNTASLKDGVNFKFPKPKKSPNIEDYLIDKDNIILDKNDPTFQKYLNNKYNKGRFNIDEILKQNYLVLDTRQSDLRLYNGKTPTLRTGRHGILYIKNGELRKLSGFEALLLQGFPLELALKAKNNINNSTLLSQAGNAMTVSVIEAIGEELLNCIQQI
jgi:DNA (cytosine-5)-methyltransferase 1